MAMARRIDMHVFVHTKVLLILCTFIGGVPLTHLNQPFNHLWIQPYISTIISSFYLIDVCKAM